jgi:hypothetical protein
MDILMIAINDPAGTGILFSQALNRHTQHDCRLVTLETRYNHSWDHDLHLPCLDRQGLEELESLLRESEVFHFHMTADEHLRLGPFLVADYIKGKAIVHHHHGHPDFRANPLKYQEKYRRLGRGNLLVSTPDLLRLLPKARWQPNLVPVHEDRYMPLQRENKDWEGVLRLTHSPTRRDLKNTDELLRVVREMRQIGEEIELDLIDNVPHRVCLERKKISHACFDHMQGYFGMSSLESLSHGLATIAGLDDWCREHAAAMAGTDDLPWVVARNAGELRGRLAVLCREPHLRREAGERARNFMVEYWSDQRWAGHLGRFYEQVE